MGQCRVIVDGRPCQARVVKGTDYCWFHGRSHPAVIKSPEHPSIIEAFVDDNWFGPCFPNSGSWAAWTVFLRAVFGLRIEPGELEVFQACTGLKAPREGGYNECYALCGRRSGKSRMASLIAAYTALCGPFSEMLSPGERAWEFVIATDRAQAGVVMGYIKALLNEARPDMIERETSDELHLANGISIGVKTASFRASRGYSTCLIILDELAFLRNEESVNPASEIIISLLPGRMKGAKLLGISTTYARQGYLYDTWKQYYGKEAKVLIWRAGVSVMHPDIDPEIIQELMERDPIAMAAELNADWRDDISTYISDAVLRACMTARFEFPEPTKYRYRAFLDSSGGKNDSMCLAVGRFENGKSIITRVEEVTPPFDPQEVVASFARILKEHGVGRVTSDHYAGVWVSDSFIRHGIQVEMSNLSASQLYIECQALMNMGKVTLPADDEKTARQFLSLERRTRSGGQDAVDHPEGLHDDRANVCAGLAVLLQRERPWTEAEQEANMPQEFGGMPDRLRLPVARFTRTYRSAEQEMDDFMRETEEGVCKPVRGR